MTRLDLPGEDTNAFDHLTAYGIAAILDTQDPGRARIGWTDELDPRLVMAGTDWDEIGALVHEHAEAHAAASSWIQADGWNNGARRGLFSPRVKSMAPDEARAWYAERERALDTVAGPWADLDRALIGALGQPSYWSFERGETRPDHGASRWEMKTRNRGEEFVANRLRILAATVAGRSPQQIATGLAGTTRIDEAGKGQTDSRTPTGLMPPGITDNARAWCALWGLSLLPVIHSTAGPSLTAGHLGHHAQGWLYLPLMTQTWPVAQLRSALASAPLRVAARTGLAPRDVGLARAGDAGRIAAWPWLNARGVRAVVRFPVHRSPNKSAPEKWAQRGVRVLPESPL